MCVRPFYKPSANRKLQVDPHFPFYSLEILKLEMDEVDE